MLGLVRRLAGELRPAVLDTVGLPAAIEWQARDFQARTGIRCAVRCEPEDLPLDPGRATAGFRILQEALTNVARHAQATHVEVRLTVEAERLLLVVRDNGRGISDQELSAVGSLGILGMRERALALGGEVTISGAPGEGTTVAVSIPLGDAGERKEEP
jgi:signal transduction histidine kinase